MKREKIQKTIEELKLLFEDLNLTHNYDIRAEGMEDMSMLLILPDHWQKVRWSIAVARKYGLENTKENTLYLTEACLRTLAKHILTEGKNPKSADPVSIH